MTEINETLTHTVSFTRKKGLPGYSSVDAGLFIQFQTPVDTPFGDIIAQAEKMQDVLAAAVFERLDIPFEVDPGTGRVTEGVKRNVEQMLEEAFEGIEDVSEEAPAPTATPTGKGVGDTPPFDPETTDKNERALNAKWGKARWASNPDEFFDNSRNKLPVDQGGKGWKSTAPDIKHKKSGLPVWL